jgi:uncharacterized membrane protein YcaP (DUF421 family)
LDLSAKAIVCFTGGKSVYLMWNTSIAWWEFVARSVIIYLFLLILLRLTGKRQIGQMAPFDLVLLLLLSNAVQNSMVGGDNSVIGGMISAFTLVTLNGFVGILTYKSKKAEALIEGRPELLVHDGRLFEQALTRCRLTHHELNAALREAGCADVTEVHAAFLETDGNISVIAKKG